MTPEIAGYAPGTWTVDSTRSSLRFSVSHLSVFSARGTLGVRGQVVVADDPVDSSVATTIDLTSVNTSNRRRDKAIGSASLLDVGNNPTASYRSTGVRLDTAASDPAAFLLDGELTLLGATRPVPLRIRVESFATDDGRPRLVVTGRGQFDRRDFGLTYHVRPRFLDRAIGAVVDVEVHLEGSYENCTNPSAGQ
ncbi:YceI family protein [Mycobacterium paraseoulense]|uniref:YceI family protein n=1 Tax=Mycobacterium TaxID=1763 RepID=UPI0021F2D3D2|nr:YceI family protein [Mycobacterium paraseoulense]